MARKNHTNQQTINSDPENKLQNIKQHKSKKKKNSTTALRIIIIIVLERLSVSQEETCTANSNSLTRIYEKHR